MPEQDWESKFDDIYLPAYLELHETIADYLNNQLKAFIRSTLAEQRKEIVEQLIEDVAAKASDYHADYLVKQLKAKWLGKD